MRAAGLSGFGVVCKVSERECLTHSHGCLCLLVDLYQCTKQGHQPRGWGGGFYMEPPNPSRWVWIYPMALVVCFAVSQVYFHQDGWGLGCVFLLGSRSGGEQKVLCAPATPEPALQAGTTVPLVTTEPGPLRDGSVPAVGCGDARGCGVLETLLCPWCWWVGMRWGFGGTKGGGFGG